jgi:hypothetical protein
MDALMNEGLGQASEARAIEELALVRDALARLEAGAYGICHACQRPIPYARLCRHARSAGVCGLSPVAPGRLATTSSSMARVATIRCPRCRVVTEAERPSDACVYFWDCPACGAVVKPKPGDCCVFCSYGSAPCPFRTGN